MRSQPRKTPALFAVDARTGRIRFTLPLPAGVEARVPVPDPARGRLYLLATRPSGTAGGRQAVVVVVDPIGRRVMNTVPASPADRRDWIPYAGALIAGSDRLAISYHGETTTGMAIVDAGTLRPVPCPAPCRQWLGVGAAWNEEESRGLGVPFPPLAERFQRLEETLQICLQMWAGDERPYRGRHYQLERPLNVPQPLTKPHPPIMIGGNGERKTLRLVAKYAQACNIFPGPDTRHKLEVLREHCAREGRDYDEILKTAYYGIDVGENGENVGKVLDDLRGLADLGIQATLGYVRDVWRIKPLEIVAERVIPEARAF